MCVCVRYVVHVTYLKLLWSHNNFGKQIIQNIKYWRYFYSLHNYYYCDLISINISNAKSFVWTLVSFIKLTVLFEARNSIRVYFNTRKKRSLSASALIKYKIKNKKFITNNFEKTNEVQADPRRMMNSPCPYTPFVKN